MLARTRTAATLVLAAAVAACGGHAPAASPSSTSSTSSAPGRDAVVAIRAGDRATCALVRSGAVYCWGAWRETQAQPRPERVASLDHAVDLSLGLGHGCARWADGHVRCFGWNNKGQVGDGTTSDRDEPVAVTGGDHATAVAAGARTTCTLDAGAHVHCFGELADPSGLGSVVAIGAPAAYATPVLRRDGTVAVFGEDVAHAFGAPSHDVIGVRDAVALGGRSCALLRGGAIACWGSDARGERGDGSPPEELGAPTARTFTATRVANIDDAIAVSAGGGTACALRKHGSVACWGNDRDGEVGDGVRSLDPVTRPVPVVGLDDATAIAVGGSHACALRRGGQVVCWGDNLAGQLGDGTQAAHARPAPVIGLPGGPAVAASHDHDVAANVYRFVVEVANEEPAAARNRFAEECAADAACQTTCADALANMLDHARFAQSVGTCLPALVDRVAPELAPHDAADLREAASAFVEELRGAN